MLLLLVAVLTHALSALVLVDLGLPLFPATGHMPLLSVNAWILSLE
jgi:hypothetical protein